MGLPGRSGGASTPMTPPKHVVIAATLVALWAVAYVVRIVVLHALHHGSFAQSFTGLDVARQCVSGVVVVGGYVIVTRWRPSRARVIWTLFVGLVEVVLTIVAFAETGKHGTNHNNFGAMAPAFGYALLVLLPLMWFYYFAPRPRAPKRLRKPPPSDA